MKTSNLFRSLIMISAALMLLTAAVPAQRADAVPAGQPLPIRALAIENFNYPAGALIKDNGWTTYSGTGTNPMAVATPGLTYSGYAGSGIGNAVAMTTSGEDSNRLFTGVDSGTVYAACLVNVSASTATGDYFFHLTENNTTFKGRVFVKKDAASNNFAFGVSKQSTSTISYTPFSYTPGTTYLLVLKYTFNSGSSTDDNVVLYVDPSLAAEPASPTLTYTDTTSTDANALYSISLRQGSSANASTQVVDGIRVGRTWSVFSQASIVPNVSLDFSGDGRSDYALTRDSGGLKTWYILRAASSSFEAPQWGVQSDNETPADYDGDGKTDVAIWRSGPPNSAAFYILQTSNNTVKIETFGQNGDNTTVIRDYDGDGKADVSVYRPGATAGAQSFFFYRASSNNPGGNITYVPWGIAGDDETSGDFDGDGRGDFAVRRNSGGNGVFYILRSSGGTDYFYFGLATDAIVPGDYDGDGRSDLAVARVVGASGNFYWLNSSNATISGPVVGADPDTDYLAPGDYDGDGKTDIALWRETNGIFYVRNTNTGVWSYVAWGSLGDNAVGEWNVTGGGK